jgi:hypothetical protein
MAEIPRKQVANIMAHLSIVSQVMRAENVAVAVIKKVPWRC